MPDLPFSQMNDAQVEELARRMGVQMPPRAPLNAGDFFTTQDASGKAQGQQLVPLAAGGQGPQIDPATIMADMPQPRALPAAAPFTSAGIPNLGSQLPTPGAAPDATGRPSALFPDAGAAKPLAGNDPSQLVQRGGSPFAAPEPTFTQRFVPTGMPGIGQGVFANNRDEEVAALAQQTAMRTMGMVGGTGFGANGDYFSPNGAAFGLAAAQMGQHAGADVMRMLQGTDQLREQGRQAEANRQAEVERANIAGRAHVAGAAAAHSPQAIRGKLLSDMGQSLLQGNLNPEAARAVTAFLGQLEGAGSPALPGVPGATAAPGQVPPDIMGAVERIKQGREGTTAAASAFGAANPQTGQFQQGPIDVGSAERFADELSRMQNPEQRAAVMRSVMEGRFGDRAPILNALAQAAARNAYLAQGLPLTNLRAMNPSQIPGSVTLPYGDRPLLTLGMAPESGFPLGRRMETAAAGGVPWNRLTVQGGPTIPFNPGDLGGWMSSSVLGKKPDGRQANQRAQLLMEALGQAYPQQPR
jgi:hypothetical protein